MGNPSNMEVLMLDFPATFDDLFGYPKFMGNCHPWAADDDYREICYKLHLPGLQLLQMGIYLKIIDVMVGWWLVELGHTKIQNSLAIFTSSMNWESLSYPTSIFRLKYLGHGHFPDFCGVWTLFSQFLEWRPSVGEHWKKHAFFGLSKLIWNIPMILCAAFVLKEDVRTRKYETGRSQWTYCTSLCVLPKYLECSRRLKQDARYITVSFDVYFHVFHQWSSWTRYLPACKSESHPPCPPSEDLSAGIISVDFPNSPNGDQSSILPQKKLPQILGLQH